MQTSEIKTSSSASNTIQKKQQPFFNKEGQDSFFSKSNAPTSSFFNVPVVQPKFESNQLKEDSTEGLEPVQRKFESTSKKASTKSSQKTNRTGLPNDLKSGVENLSGYSMDDVNVHYNSSKPAQLNAHAYAQGTDIHLATGQEKHLPHEAWHIVQQKQGRVKSTMQMKGGAHVNDDVRLEKEADVMGAKSLNTKDGLGNNILNFKGAQSNFVQLMKNKLVKYSTSDYAADAREWREEEDLGGRNIATLCYTEKATQNCYRTSEHSDGKHSEKLLYEFIVEKYGKDYKDKLEFHWLFTERETCGSDYNDCSGKVPDWFDLKLEDIKTSVAYPCKDEMSSSEEDDTKADKAKRRRARGSNIIRRLQTRATQVSQGEAEWEDPYSGGITSPMSPSHYSTDEQYNL